MSKVTFGTIKMIIPAGKATMGPPVGSSLGQAGVPAKAFCDSFNEQTKNYPAGTMLPVKIPYKNSGKTFEIIIKTESTTHKLKRILNIDKFSKEPGKNIIGSITMEQIDIIAKEKMIDNTASSLEQMRKTVIGTARSCGLNVVA